MYVSSAPDATRTGPVLSITRSAKGPESSTRTRHAASLSARCLSTVLDEIIAVFVMVPVQSEVNWTVSEKATDPLPGAKVPTSQTRVPETGSVTE